MKKILMSLFTFAFIFGLGFQGADAQEMNFDDELATGSFIEVAQEEGDTTEDEGGVLDEVVDDEGDAAIEDDPTADEDLAADEEGAVEEGGELPETATNYGNGIFAGLAALLAGAVLFFRKKARTNN